MKRSLTVVAGLLLTLTLAGCVDKASTRPSTGAAPASDDAQYRALTIGAVMAFDATRLYDWSAPDSSHVVLWTQPNRAYYLSLAMPCAPLAETATIGVTGGSFARVGVDSVVVQGQRCLIRHIERLDTRRLKAAAR